MVTVLPLVTITSDLVADDLTVTATVAAGGYWCG